MSPGSHRQKFVGWAFLVTLVAALLVGLAAIPAPQVPAASEHSLPRALSVPEPAAASHNTQSSSASGPKPVYRAAPSLTADGQDPAAIGLSWTDTTTGTFTNFTVQEASQMSAWSYSTVAVLTTQASTTYVASGLSPGTDYDWQVVENYQTCFLLSCSFNSQTTNPLNLTQPAVAYLNATAVTSTSVTLNWTNNATYGALITFVSYSVWKEVNGGTPSQVTSISTESTTSYVAGLLAGTNYSFLVKTSDCIAACGSGNPVTEATQSNLVTIGAPQTLSVSVFALHGTIDSGQSDFFTCTPTGGKSPFTYSWDFGNGTLVRGTASESVLLATGLVTITCQVTDAEPSTASQSVSVLVNPILHVTVSKNRVGADVGETIAFSCTAVNGTTPYTLAWTFGDGSTSTIAAPSYAYTTPGPYVPTCLVSDTAGATEAPSLPIVISPALGVSASASSTSAAPGTQLTFAATATNGSGTYTLYSWSFGSGASASGARVTYAFPSSQTATVQVQVIDSNGAATSGSITVHISPISVTATRTTASATTGEVVSFTSTASGGAGGPFNFTWSFGDGHVGFGATVNHAYASTGNYTPTLTVKDRLGATNTTRLAPFTVATAPGPFSWFTGWVALGIVVTVVVLLVVLLLVRTRRAQALELAKTASPYIPPTDPKGTIFGSKVCEFCGTTNLPIRTTCRQCGKPLPKGQGA